MEFDKASGAGGLWHAGGPRAGKAGGALQLAGEIGRTLRTDEIAAVAVRNYRKLWTDWYSSYVYEVEPYNRVATKEFAVK